ncbi:MAG: exodeoxyribonuclease VII small subunit [Elusimicrobia bacterium]|nr:exodeoxyribonuclease VII small subunit [Elusimicrobiota bacterium]
MSKTNAKESPKESFEESLQALEALVRQLESGEKGLEDSLQLFEKGIGLAKTLTKRLEEAKTKVELLTKENGKVQKRTYSERD